MTVHVRVETRRVYVSARGARLTKRAAYIAAAKDLIAKACDCDEADQFCKERGCACSASKCRFHSLREVLEDGVTGRMLQVPAYYNRVLPRLVRFLKFVDRRRDGR